MGKSSLWGNRVYRVYRLLSGSSTPSSTSRRKGWVVATALQGQRKDFPNGFHPPVEILGLSVATPERRDSGDVVALFVALDQHSEFS
jgi:hypothetical protein